MFESGLGLGQEEGEGRKLDMRKVTKIFHVHTSPPTRVRGSKKEIVD